MAAPFTFQAFTLKANGRLATIITDVSVYPGHDPAAPPNQLPEIKTKALWDTGASRSVLSEQLAADLKLVPIRKTEVHHADGVSLKNVYLVNLMLPNHVGVAGIEATEFPTKHNNFSVLIGMDVIGHGDFTITNVAGQTCMSFRLPSCETVDYVVEANRLMKRAFGPNAPCWCGSGKKAKKCHRV